jgi:hypothetical protein
MGPQLFPGVGIERSQEVLGSAVFPKGSGAPIAIGVETLFEYLCRRRDDKLLPARC